MIDWERVFADAGWFHWSGIAAAISQDGADACREAIEVARRMGLTISCDLNFRKKLWNYGRTAAEVMQPLVQYSDVLFGAEPDLCSAAIPHRKEAGFHPELLLPYRRFLPQM